MIVLGAAFYSRIKKKNELKIILKCNSKTVDLNKFLLVPLWSEAGAVAFNFKGRLPQELSLNFT
jgi:hypothetical protein